MSLLSPILARNSMDSSLLQPKKALFCINVTDAGIFIFVIAAQSKAFAPIETSDEEDKDDNDDDWDGNGEEVVDAEKLMDVNLVQAEKAEDPIEVTEDGISIEFKPHLQNAKEPIDKIEFEMSIETNWLQSRNAEWVIIIDFDFGVVIWILLVLVLLLVLFL